MSFHGCGLKEYSVKFVDGSCIEAFSSRSADVGYAISAIQCFVEIRIQSDSFIIILLFIF